MKQVIEFNVGGQCFATTKTTLERYGENMLTKMLSTSVATTKVGDAYFIDRNGTLFGHVLNILRDSFSYRQHTKLLEEIQCELDFYAIETNIIQANLRELIRDVDTVIEFIHSRALEPELKISGEKVFAIETGEEIHFLCDMNLPEDSTFEKMFVNRYTFYEFINFVAKHRQRRILSTAVGPVRFFYISH